MLEEHVHELPQHVIEGLDELLCDERVPVQHGHELPLGAHVRGGERQAAALTRDPQRSNRFCVLPKGQRDVLRLDE